MHMKWVTKSYFYKSYMGINIKVVFSWWNIVFRNMKKIWKNYNDTGTFYILPLPFSQWCLFKCYFYNSLSGQHWAGSLASHYFAYLEMAYKLSLEARACNPNT